MKLIDDTIMATDGFKLLAQGMKDKQAFGIMICMFLVQDQSPSMKPYDWFNKWAKEMLNTEYEEEGPPMSFAQLVVFMQLAFDKEQSEFLHDAVKSGRWNDNRRKKDGNEAT